MKSIFVLSKLKILIVVSVLFLSVGVTFAAVQLSVSQQKIKTLQASVTYQDVINAPQFLSPNARLLKIVDIAPETEIISAYMKVGTAFNLQGQQIDAVLGVYDDGQGVQVDGLSRGRLDGNGLINDRTSIDKTLLFDGVNSELGLLVSSSVDLSNLTSGSMQIFVNYLEH